MIELSYLCILYCALLRWFSEEWKSFAGHFSHNWALLVEGEVLVYLICKFFRAGY